MCRKLQLVGEKGNTMSACHCLVTDTALCSVVSDGTLPVGVLPDGVQVCTPESVDHPLYSLVAMFILQRGYQQAAANATQLADVQRVPWFAVSLERSLSFRSKPEQ